MKFLFIVWLLCASAFAAPTGIYSQHSTTWAGQTRYYATYVPLNLPANSPMVLTLHPTAIQPPSQLPFQDITPWENQASANGFLMVWPISSFNKRSSSWYWDAFDMDYSFQTPPDDLGFLQNLIITLTQQYAINPKAVFVAGFSSGAMMAQRMAAQASGFVAAIVAVSGQLEIRQMTDCFGAPVAANPVAVLMIHGDADTTLPYCGGPMTKAIWNETGMRLNSVDDDMAYWAAADKCSAFTSSQPLCTNGVPTPGVDEQLAYNCAPGGTVQVLRRIGGGHVWGPGTEAQAWAFFQSHARQ